MLAKPCRSIGQLFGLLPRHVPRQARRQLDDVHPNRRPRLLDKQEDLDRIHARRVARGRPADRIPDDPKARR